MKFKDRKVTRLPYNRTYTQEQRLERKKFEEIMKKAKKRNIRVAIILILFTCIYSIGVLYLAFDVIPDVVRDIFGVHIRTK